MASVPLTILPLDKEEILIFNIVLIAFMYYTKKKMFQCHITFVLDP